MKRTAKREQHGMRRSPEYCSWRKMVERCINPRAAGFENYGGRGIIVCDRWLNSFSAFFADMGIRPSLQHSIDRYPDKNGNYEPRNCRWATDLQQAVNARLRKTNKTGIAGVFWHDEKKKYEVYLDRNRQHKFLGRRSDFFEACCLRKSAEAEYSRQKGVAL